MQLSSADRALAAAFAGPAAFEPVNDAAIQFHLTITRPDGTVEGFTERFVDSIEAAGEAILRGGWGAKVVVRPEVKTSILHGKVRYPNPLHKDASAEALLGWESAHNEAALRRREWALVERQVERPSEVDLATWAKS